jgi:hypothetical protein
MQVSPLIAEILFVSGSMAAGTETSPKQTQVLRSDSSSTLMVGALRGMLIPVLLQARVDIAGLEPALLPLRPIIRAA